MVFTNLPKFSKLLKFPPFSFHLALIIPITPKFPIIPIKNLRRTSSSSQVYNFES